MITFDMGGTSTDVCLIEGGRAEMAFGRSVAGFPVRLPSIDMPVDSGGPPTLLRRMAWYCEHARIERVWPSPPPGARALAQDLDGRVMLWQSRPTALGFAAHPGIKVAMVEDLVMEFDENPPDLKAGLDALRARQQAIEDALVPIMAGLVRIAGWMDPAP